MSKKKNIENYGLLVEQAIKKAPSLEGGETLQYYITEDAIPMYEVNRWLEKQSFNSYKTGEAYAYKLVKFLRFLKGKYQMHYRDVTKKLIIEDYVKYLLYGDEVMVKMDGQSSLSAVKQHISVVKGFYEWLEEEQIIEDNPIKYGSKTNKKTGRKHLKKKFLYGQIFNFDVDVNNVTGKLKYQEKRNHLKWYKDNEIEKIIEALPTRRDKLVFKILVETGSRIGEVLGLHLDHFDHHTGTLQIRKNSNIENEASAKTGERDTYISSLLTDELLDYIRADRFEADINFSNFLFLNHKGPTKGKALEQKNYLKILKKAAEKADFDPKEIITHAGRSTHAQYLLDELYDGKVTEGYILQQMGWANISTMKPYIRAHNEKGRAKVAKQIVEKRIKLPPVKKDGED
ncbi:tyrosine-type recombinase/integrase [Priestia abyssalis]|uniref:tyrosine-type recombinase/integrase n=1 Tax=Priestia abyssalis TaxID=1221450 RepID=UPI001F370ECE|nr:tyrosine-type recombinase/integrase [Priestia abyssalis]